MMVPSVSRASVDTVLLSLMFVVLCGFLSFVLYGQKPANALLTMRCQRPTSSNASAGMKRQFYQSGRPQFRQSRRKPARRKPCHTRKDILHANRLAAQRVEDFAVSRKDFHTIPLFLGRGFIGSPL